MVFIRLITDSNLAPVLVLRSLNKYFMVYKRQPPLAWVLRTFVVERALRVIMVGLVEIVRLKQIKLWPCGGNILHRNTGAFHSM